MGIELAMKDLLEEAAGLDYYQNLDVPRDAVADRLEAAYLALVRAFHPDAQTGAEARELGVRLTKLFNEAHHTLSDAGRRALYDEGLAADPPRLRRAHAARPTEAAPPQPRAGAPPVLHPATQAERRGDLEAAERLLSLARSLDPGNAFYAAKLSELRARMPRR